MKVGAYLVWTRVIGLAVFFTVLNAQTCTHSRTIQTGDTCDSIAQTKQCSNAQLLYINPTLNCNNLPVGTKICTATPDYDCQPVIKVKQGDSCYSIAQANGISQQQLRKDNPGMACDSLYAGKMVCVATLAPGQSEPLPTSTTSSVPQATATSHGACTHSRTIQEGDTCDSIAKEKGASRYQLQRVNTGLDCTNLHIGDKICTATAEYDCQPIDTIVTGDTCYNFAKRNGISVDQLLSDNPDVDCNALYVDQVLCVAKSAPGQSTMTTTTTTTTTTSHAPVTSPTSTACAVYATVQSGDSCESLGKRYSRTKPDLEYMNPDHTSLCSSLIQGEGICIDGPLRKCDKTQMVKSGDSCYDLAKQAGISLDLFYEINPDVASDCSDLSPDQTICLAKRTDYGSGSTNEDCTRMTTIRVGDTCERIAARASLTSLQLHGLNTNLNCSEIIIGEQLCSFAPNINVCPSPRIIKFNDTCYDLAQNASMSLQEWKSVQMYNKKEVECDALPLSNIVCQARGNATLPSLSGDNPDFSPRCSSTCDYKTSCCSAFSVCMPLASDYCSKTQGCQENCQGDEGVTIPKNETVIGGPNDGFNNTVGGMKPILGCDECKSSECCATIAAERDDSGNEEITSACMERNTWYCLADNGCSSNCLSSVYDYAPIIDPYYYRNDSQKNIPQFVFPAGDYSDNDGNPCYGCAENECCNSDIQCHSLENDKHARCWTAQGCLFNCNTWVYLTDEEGYDLGEEPTSTHIKRPFSTQTSMPIPSFT